MKNIMTNASYKLMMIKPPRIIKLNAQIPTKDNNKYRSNSIRTVLSPSCTSIYFLSFRRTTHKTTCSD